MLEACSVVADRLVSETCSHDSFIHGDKYSGVASAALCLRSISSGRVAAYWGP